MFSNHNNMILEINYKKKIWKKHTNMWWRINKMLLNNESVNQEIKEEINKHLETNENENAIVQHLWHTAKAVRGNFIVIRPTSRNKKIFK